VSDAPRLPNIHVSVADGAPRSEIINRVRDALPAKEFARMREIGFPAGYAMTVDYIREWVCTD
jgi:hypothetical protein